MPGYVGCERLPLGLRPSATHLHSVVSSLLSSFASFTATEGAEVVEKAVVAIGRGGEGEGVCGSALACMAARKGHFPPVAELARGTEDPWAAWKKRSAEMEQVLVEKILKNIQKHTHM